MITYGTNPGMVVPLTGAVPQIKVATRVYDKALGYMGFHGGEAMLGKRVDVVFIGSCTNGRLEDLQAVAKVLKGRKVAAGVKLLIVPGSQANQTRRRGVGPRADFQGRGRRLARIRLLHVLGMNGDTVAAGQYSISTSNRNFEGRQGVGARTLLVSPAHRGGERRPRQDHRPEGASVMEPLQRVHSKTVVIDSTNIDTDQIIPARFLTTTTKEGWAGSCSPTGAISPMALRTRILR